MSSSISLPVSVRTLQISSASVSYFDQLRHHTLDLHLVFALLFQGGGSASMSASGIVAKRLRAREGGCKEVYRSEEVVGGCLLSQVDAVRLQRNPIDRGGAKHVKVAGAPRAAGQVWRPSLLLDTDSMSSEFRDSSIAASLCVRQGAVISCQNLRHDLSALDSFTMSN
jgi:hypothetical protein